MLHVVFCCRRPELFGPLQKAFEPWSAYVHISLNPREAVAYLSQLSTPNLFVAIVGEGRANHFEPVKRYASTRGLQVASLEEK